MGSRFFAPARATALPSRIAAATWAASMAVELVALVAVVGAALVLRLPAMHRGLGQDELFSIVNFIDVPSLWTTVSTNDAFNNHVGYSLSAYSAEALFGRSEWVYRAPALLFGLIVVPAFWFLARSVLPCPWPVLGALLLALSPPAIAWSTSARGYSALICFTLLSSVLYMRLLRRPRRREAWLFVIVSVLGNYMHLYAAQVTLVQGLLLLRVARGGGWRLPWGSRLPLEAVGPGILLRTFPVIAATTLVWYLPVLRPIVRDLIQRGHGAFDPLFPAAVLAELSGLAPLPLIALFLGIAALGAIALRRTDAAMIRYLAALFFAPVTLMVVSRPIDLYPRFFAYFLPYLVLAFVAGLHTLWRGAQTSRGWPARLLAHAGALLAITIVVFDWSSAIPNAVHEEGYREASRLALAAAPADTPICTLGGARTVWRYYLGPDVATPHSIGEFLALASGSHETRCVYYQASWQDAQQSEIADYLRANASSERVQDLVVFSYRSEGDAPGSAR